MGITKTEGFATKVNDMAAKLKAIGHPARLSIMIYLAGKDSCICNDIVDELPLAQPTISRHLTELKNVGLIKGSISGKNICYCVDKKEWTKLELYLKEISKTICKNDACC